LNSLCAREYQPNHFGKSNSKKEQDEMPSHFGSDRKNREGKILEDHYSKPLGKKERGYALDHFSSGRRAIERSEKDLQGKGAKKQFWRKNFKGEHFRIINFDPNKNSKSKKAHRKKKKKTDPFSRNSRKLRQPQMPKGQNGLFENGVLPKMKDL
jgi:hypothetical protein